MKLADARKLIYEELELERHYELSVLEPLLSRHPSWHEKKAGATSLVVKQNKINKKAREIYLVRTNGSLLDISWRVCCTKNPKKNSKLSMIKGAAREAIWQQVADKLPATCKCGNKATEVDHVSPTFAELFNSFTGFDRADNVLLEDCKITNRPYLSSPAQRIAWQQFHRVNAVLEPLCHRCHVNKNN